MPHGGVKKLGWHYVLIRYYSYIFLTPANTATIVHHQNRDASANSLSLWNTVRIGIIENEARTSKISPLGLREENT